MSGSWQAERTRRHPRDDPRAEVGEDVRVGVGVGPMEFKLYQCRLKFRPHRNRMICIARYPMTQKAILPLCAFLCLEGLTRLFLPHFHIPNPVQCKRQA